MDGPAKALAENADVKEFYLGLAKEGRKSFRDMKSYRRRKRWLEGLPAGGGFSMGSM
jgi:branched-chain amino acid transport system ATP-binding protein